MKKGYWVCIYEKIYSEEKLKEYAIKSKLAVEKFSGKFLVIGGKSRKNDGINSPRVVVVEFPNFDSAIVCYDATEYQEAQDILEKYANRHHQIVEGD